jgi:glucosamine-6-phosphate deaminase
MGDVYVCVYGGSPGGGSRTRAVRLAESTRRVNAADFEADRAPERAITVGPATICEARGVLLLASGANKARAVAAAVEVSEEVPASVVRRDPKRIFLIDKGAGSDLGGGLAD